MKIRPGQYVAIVGKRDCGKSTLMRILLGFETPQKGAVYYDGKDLTRLDLKSLRRKIGVVMQDGKLFSGDLYSNIVISAPWLTLDNVTQKKVSDSLDKCKSTRIIIAHRLSRIRQCDRIIVLDQGRIIEDGAYDKLMKENGFFAELVARQQLDAANA